MESKKCTKCGIIYEKPIETFSKRKDNKIGLRSYTKMCIIYF